MLTMHAMEQITREEDGTFRFFGTIQTSKNMTQFMTHESGYLTSDLVGNEAKRLQQRKSVQAIKSWIAGEEGMVAAAVEEGGPVQVLDIGMMTVTDEAATATTVTVPVVLCSIEIWMLIVE